METPSRVLCGFEEFNEDPSPYRWTWGIDGIDMEDEDPTSIGFQVVNHDACRPEDRDKKAPAKARRRRRKKQAI